MTEPARLVTADALPWRLRKPGWTHKYAHGHVLVVSGGMGRTGAARLAARGALRIGAGLVTVASPPSAMMENAAHLTAIMLRKVKDADALAAVLADPRINAVVLGPGGGVGKAMRAMARAALAVRVDQLRTVLLDADALTSFADEPETLFDAVAASHCATILTPHDGEFARLFPDVSERLGAIAETGPAYSKVDAAREAAARSGATVLLKGPDTVVASPDGRCAIASAAYGREAPWLATAGSGDVLAGMLAGLAARGVENPAANAAWLHQEAGRRLGPGLIAEDIPEALPDVLKAVLGWKAPDE